MSNKNVKLYKNPDREKPEVLLNKYVPQYQLMGVEPEEYHGATVTPGTSISRDNYPLPPTNPGSSRLSIRQPYAVPTPSPVGRGRGPVPNIGNNLEHTWSSVDGEIIEEELIDDVSNQFEDQQMIDNNDFVSDRALNTDMHGSIDLSMGRNQSFMTEQELKNALSQDSHSAIETSLSGSNISENDLILMVKDSVFAIGDKEKIELIVKDLIFGEHPVCNGIPVSADDMLVLRSVPIKVGVFLG